MSDRPRSTIPYSAIPSAIHKLTQLHNEFSEGISLEQGKTDIAHIAKLITNKINARIDDVFGQGTADAADFWVELSWFIVPSLKWNESAREVTR
jgi:hypothetical protein